MEVITIDSRAYQELIDKIDRIANHVIQNNVKEDGTNREIWLDNQELANLLCVSKKTLQRLRKENLISYTMLRGRCLYKLSEIESSLNSRIITCDPQTLDDFRRNYLLKNGTK